MVERNRNIILAELVKYTGKQVPWQFIKKTPEFIPQIERFHNLITGIYKPAWSDYALSIVIRPTSPYQDKDEILFLDDGRWLMTYSPRTGGMKHAENRSLVKCMDDRTLVAVFRQVTDKNHKRGSTYRVLGLGMVTNYDPDADVFIVENADLAALEKITDVLADETARYEAQLYAQIMNEFRPFVREENLAYVTEMPKRDQAFREIVLREYDYTCAVCGLKFRWEDLAETTAAHIIPKHKNGTDDPRNGLSLCRTHHWAFDNGVFALSEKYEILLSPIIGEADTENFALLEMSRHPVLLPQSDVFNPHLQALAWHRENVWHQ